MLTLPIKKKWFNMILSGEKKEEYEKLEETGYFGKEGYNKPVMRSCQLSFRKYGDECELLITDYEGNFLTYSKLNFCFDDDVFTHIFDIEEVRLSNENLYNKIMKQNFCIGNWNELVLSNDFEYKSVYEIESNYTKEHLLKVLEQ